MDFVLLEKEQWVVIFIILLIQPIGMHQAFIKSLIWAIIIWLLFGGRSLDKGQGRYKSFLLWNKSTTYSLPQIFYYYLFVIKIFK